MITNSKINSSVANLGVVQIRETFEVAQRLRGGGSGMGSPPPWARTFF